MAHEDILAQANAGAGRHILPSGALAGLDGLHARRKAADRVTLVTRKPPASLGRQDVVAHCVFAGSAREAIARSRPM